MPSRRKVPPEVSELGVLVDRSIGPVVTAPATQSRQIAQLAQAIREIQEAANHLVAEASLQVKVLADHTEQQREQVATTVTMVIMGRRIPLNFK